MSFTFSAKSGLRMSEKIKSFRSCIAHATRGPGLPGPPQEPQQHTPIDRLANLLFWGKVAAALLDQRSSLFLNSNDLNLCRETDLGIKKVVCRSGPSFTGDGNDQSSALRNSDRCLHVDRSDNSRESSTMLFREPSVFTQSRC